MSKLRRSVVLGLTYLCLFGLVFASVVHAGDRDVTGRTPRVRAFQGQGDLVLAIHEVMAANCTTMADPQGEYDDWIELHNFGPTALDLGGMYLTDDLNNPRKWQIPTGNPARTTIGPDGYLLIWADGDIGDSGLHANFKLDAEDGEIGLFFNDGEILVDSVAYENQRADVAFGRRPEDPNTWGFMISPTPESANSQAYEGVVSDVTFDRKRGFYESPFEVVLDCETPGARVYYTLDGTLPYSVEREVPFGAVYSGPIHIDKTTCLRVIAIRDGWLPSNTDTQTYIFIDDVLSRRQADVLSMGYPSTWYGSYPADYEMDPEVVEDPAYAGLMDEAMRVIPTLSLVSDKSNFFSKVNDPESGGIYIYTGHSSTGGQDWERPVSAELFTADGKTEFSLNCGIRIQGGEGRKPEKCPKHSFSLRFRSEYGPSKLKADLFEGSPVDTFESIQLRGFFNNSWAHWDPSQRARTQYIRDQWMRDCLLDMGQADAGQGFFVHLYINGIYWGIYNLQERPVAPHYAAYHGGDADEIDAINGGRATDGTTSVWQQTRSMASSRDWTGLSEALDVDNFIDWSLLNIFAGNVDLKTDGNWRAAGGGPDRRPWRFYSWDAEHVLESVNQSSTSPSDDPTGMFRYLRDMEEFVVRFGDHVHKHLFNGGVLSGERNTERWNRRANELAIAVIAESARWGDYRRDVHSYSSGPYYLYTRDEFWIPEWDRLLSSYFPRRTDLALQRFRSMGLYPNVDAPVFQVNNVYQHGGHMGADDRLSIPATAGTVWYTLDGSDPRQPATTAGSTDEITLVPENATKKVLVPTGPVSDTWRGGGEFNDVGWISGSGGVGFEASTGYEAFFNIDVFSQMYGNNSSCYIRIPFNVTVSQLDEIGGLRLNARYDDGFVAYLNGIEVQRVVFSGTPTWNSSASGNHSDIDAIVFEWFDLSGFVDELHDGQNILAIHGLNASPTSSDFLISVELVASEGSGQATPSGVSPTALAYTAPITLAASTKVKARAFSNSGWSALNEAVFSVGPVAENLRISEIMYHPADLGGPDDPNTEYIELTNIGTETINLNLVKFTNGIDFTFGFVELAPGNYTLIVRDMAAFETKYGNGLPIAGQYTGNLSNSGERIELQDAAGMIIHTFSFEDNWYDTTDGGGFSLTVKDPVMVDPNTLGDKASWRPSAFVDGSPGFDDSADVVALGAVVINEVMANPDTGQPDWIELHNTTNRTIDLGGWFLSDDVDELTKYEIDSGITISAGGYVVFYQGDDFSFGLSRDGETIYLHSGLDGVITGYSEQESFDASETGVSLGRYLKSTEAYSFVPLSTPTPGAANAQPKVGPVVINEIMYNSPFSADAEFVELLNISDTAVTFYDVVRGAPWRFSDDPDDPAIELLFPSDSPVSLAPGQCLMVVKDLVTFSQVYAVPNSVQVFEWGNGRLSNGQEKIQLSKPGDEDDDGKRSWIRVDRVVYSDGSHGDDFAAGIDPWPASTDGQGLSLTRIDPHAYGNDPANWQAAAPSPGVAN